MLPAATDAALRAHVRALLTQGQAHLTAEAVLADFPLKSINRRWAGVPYSAFEVLWHLRFTQRDILDFVRPAPYEAVPWPQAYWPQKKEGSAQDWQNQVQAFRHDQAALLELLDDPHTDLLALVPNGKEDQTWLRAFLLVADHNAYHLGQLVLLERLSTGEA
ncbi:DinB family protein [Deinococcus sp. HMF7620]|uniref:DinB family protein n=1 Tax=Deinococcus arboris TaxID=2682977 RepID=A0A7C9HRY5_9DEIO|nr:DinB family protein [Deinococcus arboris]MVN87292.1 DinB family protein [Deinococcus arboris]